MGLETGSYVNDLVVTNPAATDQVAQGDDHLRFVKTVLKATFPNASKPFYFPDFVSKTSGYPILSTDQNKLIAGDATGGAFNLTLPTLAAGDAGWSVLVFKSDAGANAVTLVGTINGNTNLVLSQQYLAVLVEWTGTVWRAFALPSVSSLGALIIAAATVTNLTLSGLLDLSSVTGGWKMPVGTTAQRPSHAAGYSRFNSTLGLAEYSDGSVWRQPSVAQPIASGFKNLAIDNDGTTPDTKIHLTADAVTVETSAGTAFRLRSVDVTINCATTGANGLDAGGLANDTFYFVFVIYNPTTDATAGLASLSATAPTLPSGYTASARFGARLTDSAGKFHRIRQRGNTAYYVVSAAITTALPKISNGVEGTFSQTTPSWSSKSIVNFVPTTAYEIGLTLQPGGSGANIIVAPSALYGGPQSGIPCPIANVMEVSSSGAAIAWLGLEATTIQVASSASTGLVSVTGWRDNL